ncbi:hypothetical protein [Streptomyces sp. NPDC049590]|uniref:hypothetical protein n=1 Tax=Streptomyces sp. NPDC049590 TaxID=3154834 RepID=UPI003431A68A
MALDDARARPAATARPAGPSGAAGPLAGTPLFAGDGVLPCGRPLSRVWEQARDAAPSADPHIVSCPHCREAVDGLATMDAATRALRAEAAAAHHALAGRVMDTVRAEVRLGRLLPLADPDQDLRITECAAARVLREAADAVPGARAASCRLAPEGESTGVRAAMTVAAAADRPLPDRAGEVRRSVLHSADRTWDSR